MKISLGSGMEIVFHNVGQGLFTSGNCCSFRYVYDCGTNGLQSLLDTRISEFIQSLGKTSAIDVLIISHMHSDHTSGLDKLLSRVHVDTVYLPYLLPSERIVIGWQEKEFLDTNPWFSDFLIDPANWFLSRGVNSVVFFRQSLPKNRESDSRIDNDSGSDSGPKKGTNKSDLPGASLISQLEDDAKLMNSYLNYELSTPNPVHLYFKKHHNEISSPEFLMKFYNVCTDPKIIASLENDVKNMLSIPKIDQNALKVILKDSSLRDNLMKNYEKFWSNLNNTSLCSFLVSSSNKFCSSRIVQTEDSMNILLIRKLGIILTGDISLRRKKAFDKFSDHYKGLLTSTKVFQVPHHGSKYDWNSRLLDEATDAMLWIVSASRQCNYGHPSNEIISSVVNRNRVFLWVDEDIHIICCTSFANKFYLSDCMVVIEK
ncbi:hypothetical protein RM69_04350 [Mesotoga sp. SC_NapDC3]|nr:hypothetical protein RM69_04350 [Mesotoga sp. SC_NapDC3]PXF33376.1 hypothetical protein EU77_14055 [Mesotoga sp. SC_NapDC]